MFCHFNTPFASPLLQNQPLPSESDWDAPGVGPPFPAPTEEKTKLMKPGNWC